ncbi:MAG: ABC transporter ATP-binding protein, partial [Microbacterium gubbeenense]
ACIRADEIRNGVIDGEPVFPPPVIPESELLATPREERKETLRVENLTKTFPLLKGALAKRKVGEVHAVKNVSFDIREGETLAIVGESGSGKTTTLLEIMELAQHDDGDIVIGGTSVKDIGSKRHERALRRDIQIVFQDPMGALDPRMTVFDIIAEPLRTIGVDKNKTHERVDELMGLVGLNPAHGDRFPQAFSGGQRQRIGIARALATEPRLIVLDEPVSALDVSIQAGVINLLDELKAKLGISYLFVAHDLSVVRHLADRVAVMYLGQFVELGDVDEVFDDPQHPYTQALLSAIPVPDPHVERTRERVVLTGDLPSPTDKISGCPFVSRCPLYQTLDTASRTRCEEEPPQLTGREGVHTNACHFR